MLKESSERQTEIASLMLEARSAFEKAEYSEAERLYKKALSWLDYHQADDAPETALCLQNLAEIYYLSGQLYAAIPLYRRLLSIGEQVLGESHPDVLATAFRLALTYDAVQMSNEADDIYKRVTNSAERTLGINHPFAQKIRDTYFAFMANRTPSDDFDFRFALTPPPAQSEEDAGGEPGHEAEDPAQWSLAVKKPSTYKIPAKIKRLRYGAQSAEEKVNTAVGFRNVWQRWRSGAIAVACLVIFLGITFFALSRAQVGTVVLPGNQAIARLRKLAIFQSVDGIAGIKFTNAHTAILQNDIHHTKIPCVVLSGGTFDDLQAMLTGAFTRRERWYRFVQDALISEEGNILYAKAAPEHFVANKMRILKQFAQKYYLKTGCYPNDARKWNNDPELDYISPFSGRVDTPSVKNLNGTLEKDYLFPNIQPNTHPNAVFEYLRAGGPWRDEAKPQPGKINALALFMSQRCADGFKVNEFYIHGYDRNMNLLTGAKPGTFYVIGLKSGEDLGQRFDDLDEETQRCSFHVPDRICIVTNPNADLSLMHQGLPLIVFLIAFACLVAWIFFEFRKRLAEPKRLPQPYEMGLFACVLLLIIITIIHALP